MLGHRGYGSSVESSGPPLRPLPQLGPATCCHMRSDLPPCIAPSLCSPPLSFTTLLSLPLCPLWLISVFSASSVLKISAYSPVKRGGRFSLKAASASPTSPVAK